MKYLSTLPMVAYTIVLCKEMCTNLDYEERHIITSNNFIFFAIIPGCSEGVLLVLCSGITFGGVQETISDARFFTQNYHIEGGSACCTISQILHMS